ncbi:hypothetical protein HZ326_19794 [Fusarium oxysporum f. sp. albedinis]|nr:hypothetical protein HZ326_19794 [Fusarium oxysporum f. sp. albedinis]
MPIQGSRSRRISFSVLHPSWLALVPYCISVSRSFFPLSTFGNAAAAAEYWQGNVSDICAVLYRCQVEGGRLTTRKQCRHNQCEGFARMQMMKRRSLQWPTEELAPLLVALTALPDPDCVHDTQMRLYV